MENLSKEHDRFFDIAAKNHGEFITRTFDVDLAWHPHQLSPKQYFNYTDKKTRAFTDPNHKVDGNRLAVSFDWMAKTYEKKYGEVYSECICWFCERLRFMYASSLSKRFTSRKDPAAPEAWRTTIEPTAEPPHISSHFSVQPLSERNVSCRTERLLFHNELDTNFAKLQKQLDQGSLKKDHKKSFSAIFKPSSPKTSNSDSSSTTMGPRGQDSATHWGQTIPLAGPWASSTHATPTEQTYAAPPGAIHQSLGNSGVYTTGTCGGMTGSGNGTGSK
ncbi:Glycine-rich domain-containing protein 1-like protein 2 [Seiridium cupressi]